MTREGRLLSASPNPLTRRLLQSGLRDNPRPTALAAAAAAFGVSAHAATTLAAATSATAGAGELVAAEAAKLATSKPAAALGVAFFKWLGFGAIAGALSSAALATAFEAKSSQAPVAGASGTPVVLRRTLPPQASASPGATASAEIPSEPIRSEKSAPDNRPPTRLRFETAASPSSPDDPVAPNARLRAGAQGQLAREALLIDRARLELANGNLSTSSRLLEDYDAIRRLGVLDREARFLAVEIAARQGDRAQASALAQQFEHQFPGDSYLPRLRRLLANLRR
jgi:hypothetical protein